MKDAERSPRHIREAKRIGRTFIEFTGERDLKKVTVKDLRNFLSQWEPGTTRRYYRSHISKLMEMSGNFCHKTVIWGADPKDIRPNVRWLVPWQVDHLLTMEKDPEEEMIIHLSLGLALRRSDIMRLKKGEIDRVNEWLNFQSKGYVIRSVPFSPETPRIIDRYEAYRDEILAQGKGPEPQELIIGISRASHNRLTGLKETALDDRLAKVRDRCPFHFSFHDLRRTWARQAWEYKVDIATISFILGHRDTKTTLKYIGVDGDHAREGMTQLHRGWMERSANYSKLQNYRITE